MPTFSGRALVTLLHQIVIRTSLAKARLVAPIGKTKFMKLLEILRMDTHPSNPETNQEIRVAGENLPVDFLTYKPRISRQVRPAPNSELHFLNRARFLSIPS